MEDPIDRTKFACYSKVEPKLKKMTDEYLTKCVVDPLAKKFYLYSSEGSEKEVFCETIDQFMNVLEVVKTQVSKDCLAYSNPL